MNGRSRLPVYKHTPTKNRNIGLREALDIALSIQPIVVPAPPKTCPINLADQSFRNASVSLVTHIGNPRKSRRERECGFLTQKGLGFFLA